MAYWLCKKGGTRAFASGGGTNDGSLDSHWENTGDYFDPESASVTALWRLLGYQGGAGSGAQDGDEIVLWDDGATPITYGVAKGTTSTTTGAGTVILRSRSGNPELVKLQNVTDGNSTLFIHGNTAAAVHYIYRGITFIGPVVAYTRTTSPAFVQASGNLTCDVTFDSVIFSDLVYAQTGDSSWGLFYAAAGVGVGRTFTLNNCEIRDLTSIASWAGSVYLGHIKAGETINITGTLDIHDITLTAGNTQIRGGLKADGVTNITADVTMTDIHVSNSAIHTSIVGSVIAGGDASTLSITGSVTGQDMSASGGNPYACMIYTGGAHDINNITANNLTVTRGTDPAANGRGGVILISNDTGIGNIKNVVANNVHCWAGAVVYYSNGGGGPEVSPGVTQSFCEQIHATNCSAGENGGGLYKGGDGSVTFRGVYIDNCHCTEGEGGGFYGMYADRNADQHCTIVLENFTITNCTSIGGGDSLHLTRSGDPTASVLHTYVRNGIAESTLDDHVQFAEGVVDLHISEITNCNISNATGNGINDDSVNTKPVSVDVTEFDPLLNDDGSLMANSQLVGAGTKYWTGPNPVGADGEPFSDWDTDIGGIQSKHSPFHPSNL